MTTLHILPNAHLDPVWLWDAREGLDQGIRTFRSVLDLMDEFPELTFLRGEAALYAHLEETDPEAFGRVRQRIREGRWEVVGGTWIQPDTNLPSARTLRRQFEVGLDYFQSHLGVRPRVAWQADAFGHAVGLPDIMADAGMESFAFWRPGPKLLRLPKPVFRWCGPNGGSVLASRIDYGWYGTSRDQIPERLDSAIAHAHRFGLDNEPVFIGLGDHGGGPSRRHVLDVRAWAAAHPDVRVVWSGLHRYFDALRAEAAAKGGDAFFPEYSGELGFTLRGCYTSCLRVKTAFRHAEAELATAETAVGLTGNCSQFTNVHKSSLNTNGTNANINDKGGASRPGEPGKLTLPIDGNEDLEFVNNCGQLSQLSIVNNPIPSLSAASESLLFNSFHDILPGSSMERAVEEQLQQLGGVRDAARSAVHAEMRALASAADTSVPPPSEPDRPAAIPFVVFNPHTWEYHGPLELEGCIDDRPDYYKPYGGGQAPLEVRDPRGRSVPFQIVPAEAQFGDVIWRSRVLFDARIPAHGFAVYTLGWKSEGMTKTPNDKIDTNENTNLRAVPPSRTLRTSREISTARFSVSARIGADGVRILRDGKPWLKGAGLQALLFRDPYGSWGTNDPRQYDESVPSVAWRVESVDVVESGPLRSALWVRLAGERSWLELVLRVAACRDVIDVEARLLWNERGKRLKLSLPCGAAAADCAVPGA
ncbi:MAG: glycoside hydrolase family 38, partial [Kiritimatiellae bacterium]|nr:glycoside hydrolase family 38 [Kiritimatiellia bacterium]